MDFADCDVLVTGGAGFIGSHLTEELQTRRADVYVVDNLSNGTERLVPDGAELTRLDIQSAEMNDLLDRVDPQVIFHLAALHYIPYCNDNPEETVDVNLMGTRQLLNAAEGGNRLEQVVYASTAAVYPPRAEPNPVSSVTGPTDIYGKTKLLGEDLLERFHRRTGVSATAARLFNVYGINETNPHLIPAILDQVVENDSVVKLGNLTPQRDFVHVSDVVEALMTLAAINHSEYRTYNVGTGRSYSVREVAESIIKHLPESIEVVQEQERVRESDRPNLQADISSIASDTDWKPEFDLSTGVELLLERKDII
jgi:UDP-glucose 4-epimerase